jgi:hypothetical protein
MKGAHMEHRKLTYVKPLVPVEGRSPEDLKDLRKNEGSDFATVGSSLSDREK